MDSRPLAERYAPITSAARVRYRDGPAQWDLLESVPGTIIVFEVMDIPGLPTIERRRLVAAEQMADRRWIVWLEDPLSYPRHVERVEYNAATRSGTVSLMEWQLAPDATAEEKAVFEDSGTMFIKNFDALNLLSFGLSGVFISISVFTFGRILSPNVAWGNQLCLVLGIMIAFGALCSSDPRVLEMGAQ